MRYAFCLALVLSGCSDNPPASPSRVPLAAGRYEVVFTAGSAAAGDVSACSTLSIGEPSLPDTSASFTATGTRNAEGGLTLGPDAPFDLGWSMTVRQSDNRVNGTVQGAARDMRSGGTTVTLDGGSPQTPAELIGNPGHATDSVGGPVAGRVVFSAGATSYGCMRNEWRMTRIG